MNWTVLSKETHKYKSVSRAKVYKFARNQILVHVSSFELLKITRYLPIVFLKDNNDIKIRALMGLQENENLLVDPFGKWKLPFIPAPLLAYPFGIGQSSEGENIVLLSDNNDIIVDREEGDPLFNEDGTETDLLKNYVRYLTEIKKSNLIISVVTALIKKFDLLEPFEINAKIDVSNKVRLSGMLRINARKFDELGGQEFLELRTNNYLEFIYAHFMQLNYRNGQ
ncbi:SapC family protein [Alphaproteobacteria bacterium]|nr:SapC family protein [Alphaproteobacteria bacterium]